ncbi:MAG: urea transporter [Chitinispirillaceae bacterium]|nr:urea transporter [Chitinispirillaceae bacterium]
MKTGNYVGNLLTSFSFLALIRNRVVGIMLLLCACSNPSIGGHALIAYTTALYCGKLIGLSRRQMVSGFYTYNSLLVGLCIGYMYSLSPLSVLLTLVASSFTVFIGYAMSVFFHHFLHLPVLNLPFTIIATLLFLASVSYSNLPINTVHPLSLLTIPGLPLWFSGLLKNLGILVFLPCDVVGLCILAVIAWHSRIMLFLVAAGYYCGTLFLWLLKGSYYSAFTTTFSFNFILIAVALGGYFLIPSPRSYVIALINVLISVIIVDAGAEFWSTHHIPVFTLPFTVVTLTILYSLRINRSPLLNHAFLETPEQDLEHHCNYSARFSHSVPQPRLPFLGTWAVYQSFDDSWTHKGNWIDAIDFVIEDRNGTTFINDGNSLDDYYCYGKPLFAPVSGTVVALCNDCADNPPGTVDQVNNWGNYVIIHSPFGYYVELSHCMRGSVCVNVNDQVSVGTRVALCGNSGYSPQPHVHFQCQYAAYAGAPAVPFFFSSAVIDSEYLLTPHPFHRGQRVRPASPSRFLERRLQLMLDDTFVYSYRYCRKNTVRRSFECTIAMSSDGSYHFLDRTTNSRLFFSNFDGVFRFYRFEGSRTSPLRLFFLALPSLPLCSENIIWTDSVNAALIDRHGTLYTFLKSFNHRAFNAAGTYRLSDETRINGTITVRSLTGTGFMTTTAEFDEMKGIFCVTVTSGNEHHELRREKVRASKYEPVVPAAAVHDADASSRSEHRTGHRPHAKPGSMVVTLISEPEKENAPHA